MIGTHVDYFVNAVRIFTHDLQRSEEFYSGVIGLKPVNQGEHFAVFDVGGVNFIVEEVDEGDEATSALVGRFLGVSLSAKDILEAFDVLSERGVEFLTAPLKQEWGGYLAHFYDPDGNIISIVR